MYTFNRLYRRRVATRLVYALATCAVFAAATIPAHAQGCIVARSTGEPTGPDEAGGYLMPGEFDVSVGYRHQFSFRHFVGDTEQTYRIQDGTQVMNKINLELLTVTYQATPRFSFSVDAPMLEASRRANNSPYTTTAQGVGDAGFGAQGWLFNPQHETLRGNVQFSLGMSFPTGKDNVQNVVDPMNGKGTMTVTDDYSIQPAPAATASSSGGRASSTSATRRRATSTATTSTRRRTPITSCARPRPCPTRRP
jgi:hypothetical protein